MTCHRRRALARFENDPAVSGLEAFRVRELEPILPERFSRLIENGEKGVVRRADRKIPPGVESDPLGEGARGDSDVHVVDEEVVPAVEKRRREDQAGPDFTIEAERKLVRPGLLDLRIDLVRRRETHRERGIEIDLARVQEPIVDCHP